MSSLEPRARRLYSQDTRRLPYLVLLASIAACTHAFSIIPFYPSSPAHPVSIRQSQHHSLPSTVLFMAPRKTGPDEEEWGALLAAFKMYKAAYGDLKVPSRFIVPGMPPWPESAWGMKLGQRVAAIRSTGKYVQNNEERRKILEKMGFLWRLRAAETTASDVSFDQLYLALQTYLKETFGKKTVPPNFVVPDCDPWPESTRGLPLGKKLATVRSKSFLKNNPGAKEKLEALGFEMDGKVAANDTRFQKVYDALVTYKKLNGDLLVPQPFVVPDGSPEWPKSTWGLRLGARVNAIRSQGTFVNTNPDRRKQLDDIGFVWSPPAAAGRRRGRRTKQEMEEQRAAEEAKMSEQLQNEKTQTSSSAMEDLFGPSFAFEETTFESSNNGEEGTPPTWSFEGSAEIEAARAAEEAAKQPQDEYQEPTNLNDTLEAAKQKAIDVGVIVVGDDGVMHKGKREKDIPWFNDDFGQDFVFEDVVEALTVYKSMYGDFSGLVENDEFMIPAAGSESVFPDDDDDDSFDVDASARAAAAIATYEQEVKQQESEDLIAAEIRRLQQETEEPTMATETEVAVQTKISSAEWPEHLAGMGLGNIVRRIRDGSLEVKHLPERKAQLDAIEFDWGDPKYFIDVPFEKAMCAMYAYYLVRGDMFVYEDFVMPDQDPWPRALAGYEIGKVVKRIRELQNSFEAYHIEKVALLRAIDFVWFPTVALPLDPNEAEMTSEMLMLSALGHPDYAKMIDIPMGLPDKIVADGPFFESDDPKLWWKKWHNWEYVKDYWYAQGRRDNAFVLRENGYPTLAEEHEAKYGPGMFQQIEELMEELNEGVENKSKEEKDAYVERLNYFREEMTGCRDIHPIKRKALLEELDTTMLALMTDGKLETVTEATLEKLNAIEEEQEEYDAVVEEEIEIDPADYGAAVNTAGDYDVGEDEDEEDFDDFDIADELGLDDEDDEEDDGEILAEAAEDDLIELGEEEDDAFV